MADRSSEGVAGDGRWVFPEIVTCWSARVPAGRWGRPGDIGNVVVFLASPAATYVHGQVLAVDGGWLAR